MLFSILIVFLIVFRIILIDKFNNNYRGFCINKIVALMVVFVSGNLVCSDNKNKVTKPNKDEIAKFLEWRRLSALGKGSSNEKTAYDDLHPCFKPTKQSQK
jgi:hypothetical protein